MAERGVKVAAQLHADLILCVTPTQINEAEPGEDSNVAYVNPIDEVLVAPGV